MRSYRVGVGDICAVRGWTRSPRVTAGGGDHWRTRGKHDPSLVAGHCDAEHDTSKEQGRDRVSIGDCARCEDGARVIHRTGPRGTDGMRGDGVGVGDVGEVFART